MLLRLLKIDETSKSSAFKVALFNALLGVSLIIFLIVFMCIIYKCYDQITAEHISRLILVEVVLNALFFPFAVLLVYGISRDNFSWMRVWVKVKVVQASYIFLLNIVMQIFITAALSFIDGLVILIYTLLIEVMYMDIIVYINNYHRHKEAEEEKLQIPEQLENVFVITI